jgi:hypothetical protein
MDAEFVMKKGRMVRVKRPELDAGNQVSSGGNIQ